MVYLKGYPYLVHRLVASTFIPNTDKKKTEVNHKDFDKSNNRVSNLEWVTKAENVDHARKGKRYKSWGFIKEQIPAGKAIRLINGKATIIDVI